MDGLVPASQAPVDAAAAAGESGAINLARPAAPVTNPAASPFRPAFADLSERAQSVDCLASAIYYEAGMEGEDGQRAVAQIVLNRVRHVAYPNSVCGVVYQGAERTTGCQFTFTCDGSLARRPSPAGWAQARRLAEAALTGAVFKPVGHSTHYHADYVAPYWSDGLLQTVVIGTHIFYRSSGAAGQPSAFTARYAGVEPEIDLRQSGEGAAPMDGTRDNMPAPLTLASAAEDIPEERAEELDRFALLDYDAERDIPATMAGGDPGLQATLDAALSHKERSAGEPIALALTPKTS